ncbi:mitochondrial carrier [Clavulina sp. PMI_390]|nr:mitochondrial carrier [Clavulina sp. PMI_390]
MTSTLPALVQATSGALGSAVANSIAYPLDVTTTRIQTQRKSKAKAGRRHLGEEILQAYGLVKRDVERRGVSGLYAGLESDTASTLLSNFLYFYAYSFLRDSVQKRAMTRAGKPTNNKATAAVALTVSQELALGFIAGVLSRTVSTPLSIVTVRLQTASDEQDTEGRTGSEAQGGLGTTIREIYEEDGIKGFWKGFQSVIILSANPAITLLLFQSLRRLILRGKSRETPSALQAFILAGLSNSIAVSVLYPIILLKTRLQTARRTKELPTVTSQSVQERPSVDPISVAKRILKQEGLGGLYQGLEVQLLKGIISQGITFSMKQRIEGMFISVYHSMRGNTA